MPSMPKEAMKAIGITGSMGAGKSSVIQIIQDAGEMVIDCDCINDALLLLHHPGYTQLVQCFGTILLDDAGRIDRKKMSDCIFSSLENKQKVEAILHPLIQQEIQRWIHAHRDRSHVFVEVPLLFESRWETYFDEIWVVACEESLRIKRLVEYRHMQIKEAKRRIAQQMSQEEKIKRADYVIYNNDDRLHLQKQIAKRLDVLHTR